MELKIIAIGIDSWAAITSGDIILEAFIPKYKNKFSGTWGDIGTFSFHATKYITSGEGGMITCKNKEDYEILKSLRSHGWSRDSKVAKKYPRLDPRYIFINSGFNLRPTDIQGAIAHNQFKRLNLLMRQRNQNRNIIIKTPIESTTCVNQ